MPSPVTRFLCGGIFMKKNSVMSIAPITPAIVKITR